MLPPDVRPEIPQGYTWKQCTGINAMFPMPDAWFFKAETKGDTQAFFMTRESVDQNGLFITGLSINTMPGIRRKTMALPSQYAYSLMTAQTQMKPISDIVSFREGPLTIYRRSFKTLPLKIRGRRINQKMIYSEATGNDQTDRFYLLMFETPVNQWQKDAENAVIMIDKRILDGSI